MGETKLKKTIQQARAGSSISWPRLIATAMAAVTMTLVSASLTSVFGSLMLTAVVSIGSALVAEFYRVVINLTAEGTKKVIAPIVSEDGLLHVEGRRTEDSQEDSKEDQEDGDEDQDSGGDEEPETHKHRGRPGQFVQLALVFGVVSLITVGISYAVASSQGGDIYQNTFETRPTQTLSDSEKQELVDQTLEILKESLPDATALQEELTSLQDQNQQLRSSLEELQADFDSQQETIATLSDQVTQLQTQTGNPGTETPEQPPGEAE